MIKMILFDLGGVVIDIPNEKYYSYLSKVGAIPVKEAELRLEPSVVAFERGDMDINKFNHIVADDMGIKRNQVLWLSHFKQIAKLNRETAQIIHRLKKNYKISFLSNVDKYRYEYGIQSILKGLMPFFSYTFASYKMGVVKPSPLIFEKVLKIMRLKPSEVLFIDNDIRNVYGAKQVGINAVHYTTTFALKKDLKRLGIKF